MATAKEAQQKMYNLAVFLVSFIKYPPSNLCSIQKFNITVETGHQTKIEKAEGEQMKI
jgi:hypothetical protein